MFDEVLIHIGLPKTGTTSIQTAMAACSKDLETSHGVLYPLFPGTASNCGNHGLPLRWLGRFKRDIPFGDPSNFMDVDGVKKVWQNLLQKECSKLILSGESLSRMPLENLLVLKSELQQTMRPHTRIRILLMLRDPSRLYISWRNELHRQQLSLNSIALSIGPDESQQDMRINQTLQRFKKAFPDAAFTVGKFEEWASGGRLLQAFGKWAALPIDLPNVRTNEGICWEAGQLNQRDAIHNLKLPTRFFDGMKGSRSGAIRGEDERAIEYMQNEINILCKEAELEPYQTEIPYQNLHSENLWPRSFFRELRLRIQPLRRGHRQLIWREILTIQHEKGHHWHSRVRRRVRYEAWKGVLSSL